MEKIGLNYRESKGSLTYMEIVRRLNNGDPILATMRYFIGWHLIVIYGIENDTLIIADPEVGIKKCLYSKFINEYSDHYSWSHFYELVT